MKRRTGWRWECLMISGACVLAGCGGDNGASPAEPPAAGVAGVARGAQSAPPGEASNKIAAPEGGQDAPAPLYVGGMVYGLANDTSLKLFNNSSELVTVNENGAFAFASPVPKDTRFDVTVAVQPQGQSCRVERAQGHVDTSSVSSVEVHCVARQQIAVVMTEKGEISSYLVDATTGELARAPGPVLKAPTDKRRLMLSPSGSTGYVIRSDLPYGERGNDRPWLNPLASFEIDLTNGRLGTFGMVNWQSQNGRVLDYAFNPHDYTLTTLQYGNAYALVKMNADNARVYGDRTFANTIDRAGKNPKLEWGQCRTNYQRTRNAMTHELVGNLRQVRKGEFGYLLRCDPERHGYRLEGYAKDHTNEALRAIDVGDWAHEPRFVEAFDVNPQGTLLFAVDGFKARLDVIRIDPATGQLRRVAEVDTAERPSRVVVSRDGLTVYVLHMIDERISAFRVDPVSGKATRVPGSPFHVGKMPTNMVVDASQTYAYVLLEGEDGVGVFAIDPKTQALKRTDTFSIDEGAHEMALTS
ncbi:MAG TPA: beta-propeller fold lactonase family protein [Pararobbsia sp.]|nr:beta-propeller fold lactonase family protein [Pararobbsia sp.]